MEQEDEGTTPTGLTDSELDTLSWAKEFMNRYEIKREKELETRQDRLFRYF